MRPWLALPALLAASALAGCLWTRFDDVGAEPSIELLERPPWVLGGYGSVMAARSDSDALLVGGYPQLSSAALLGFGTRPSSTVKGCETSTLCRLVGGPIAVPDQQDGHGCFFYGVGPGLEGPAGEVALLGGCASGPLLRRALPPAVRDLLRGALFQTGASGQISPGLLSLAAAGPAVAIGSPDLALAAVLEGPAGPPTEVKAPADAGPSFARTLALIEGPKDAPPTLAVSASDLGRVYLHEGPGLPLRACLARGGSYGVVLHALRDQERRLLVVSDAAGRVDVIDVQKVPPSTDCREPPAEALVDQLRCTEDGDVTGCDQGAFGYSLASGDFDGDGRPEVVVGAPGLNVRGVANAGAVAIFSIDAATNLPRHLFLASSGPDERIGAAVAAVRKDDRLIVASSALNKQKTPLFHCASSVPSERCR